MTPVGHSLVGAALGVFALPAEVSRRTAVGVVALFVLLANLPDLPLPGWGHDRYRVSHSLPLTLVLLLVAGTIVISGAAINGRRVSASFLLLAAAAWLSHLLLDTNYNHGLGLAMFWPLSEARLALPIPWFSTAEISILHPSWHNLRCFVLELASYGPLLATAILYRRKRAATRGVS